MKKLKCFGKHNNKEEDRCKGEEDKKLIMLEKLIRVCRMIFWKNQNQEMIL